MKKITIIITSVILLIAVIGTMQAGAQVSAGVKAGLNLSGFNAEYADELKTKPGLVAGGFVTYNFNPKWSAQGEVLYAMQGAKESGGAYDFRYLQIPLTARYNVWEGLRIHTGPQIGFLVSGKIKEGGEKYDVKDNLKGSDFSWVIGASYEWNQKFVADIRWVKGLADISDNDADVKNTAVQITLGYRLK